MRESRRTRKQGERVHSRATAFALVAALTVGLAGGGAADAKPKRGAKIETGKGVAGVNLGLKRGPISVRRGKRVVRVHTVNSILGKPQQVVNFPEDGVVAGGGSIYLANYLDDGLSVYYQSRGKTGRPDKKRDAYDKVLGVVTYTPRYQGPLAPGDGLDTSGDANCVPLDKREAPDGGPRRVAQCLVLTGKSAEIVFMSPGSPSRDGQLIEQLGIYTRGFGSALFQSLMAGALEDLGCETPACD
jgi:hypothetical protein